MNGREEKELVVQKRIDQAIADRPDYLKGFVAMLADVLPNSRYSYVTTAIRFLDYLEDKLGLDTSDSNIFKELKPSVISSYLAEFDSRSKKTTYFMLKKFFSYLEADEYIENNQFKKIKAPKTPKANDAVSLTGGEIKMLIYNILHPEDVNNVRPVSRTKLKNRELLKNRNALLVELALTDGLRNSSLLEINVDDIDFENHKIPIVQKGDRRYFAEITDGLEQKIKIWLKDRENILKTTPNTSNALFISVSGKRMTGSEFSRLLEWSSYNINKKITPHKLRSTCATLIYENTGDIYLASEMLGHSSVVVTQRYIKSDEKKKVRASKIMENIIGN